MADIEKAEVREPVAQENKLVGDEAVQAERHEVVPEVVSEQVDAQVAPPREADDDKVNVHETRVATDVVITDPSSPLAVQVPDAGRGDASLPAHALAAQTPEEALSGSEAEEVSAEDRAAANAEGRSSGSEIVKGQSNDDEEYNSTSITSDESDEQS